MTTIETTAIQLARLARQPLGLSEAATLFAISSMTRPNQDELSAWLDTPKNRLRGQIAILKRKGMIDCKWVGKFPAYSLTDAGHQIIQTTTKP